MDIINDTVMEMEGRISGGSGMGGTESVRLQYRILHFGAASGELRLTVANFAEWLGTGRPSWAT